MIQAYREEHADDIMKYSQSLFGQFDQKLLLESSKKAIQVSSMTPQKQEKLLGRVLSIDEITEKVQTYLQNAHIEGIPVDISQTTFSRMAVAYKKDRAKINISSQSQIREHEMDAILEHEIGTHLRRFLAGEKT